MKVRDPLRAVPRDAGCKCDRSRIRLRHRRVAWLRFTIGFGSAEREHWKILVDYALRLYHTDARRAPAGLRRQLATCFSPHHHREDRQGHTKPTKGCDALSRSEGD